MRARWGLAGVLFGFMAIVGCRTPQPNVKPAIGKEVLTPPPQEARFDNGDYPKEAFNKTDPASKMRELRDPNAVMPARATGMSPGAIR